MVGINPTEIWTTPAVVGAVVGASQWRGRSVLPGGTPLSQGFWRGTIGPASVRAWRSIASHPKTVIALTVLFVGVVAARRFAEVRESSIASCCFCHPLPF